MSTGLPHGSWHEAAPAAPRKSRLAPLSVQLVAACAATHRSPLSAQQRSCRHRNAYTSRASRVASSGGSARDRAHASLPTFTDFRMPRCRSRSRAKQYPRSAVPPFPPFPASAAGDREHRRPLSEGRQAIKHGGESGLDCMLSLSDADMMSSIPSPTHGAPHPASGWVMCAGGEGVRRAQRLMIESLRVREPTSKG